MERYEIERTPDGRMRVKTTLRGPRILAHGMLNKSTAFTMEERRAFGIEGLLPPHVSTMEEQARRSYASIIRKQDPLERYIGLGGLQDRNEHLFYRILIQKFSHIFRRERGLWITPDHKGRIYELLGHAPFEDVRLIVVTDNERILGLGDLGAGGMGIPIGKLALYVAAAGIHPASTLPISIDVGTDNKTLLDDPLYIGVKRPRLRGKEYDELIDEFVQAVKRRFPDALLQWEDFKKGLAFQHLERYRDALPSFNDDIQGTAAVTVSGILAGCRVSGIPFKEQRVVILGAGAAGVGIGRLIKQMMEEDGASGEQLAMAVVNLDSKGMVVDDGRIKDEYKREMAWSPDLAAKAKLAGGASLDEVVNKLKPTVLIGTSGEPDTFPEAVIKDMAKHCERPLIFPLSNPTSQSEAKPADVIKWTNGRAMVATGSPFAPVQHGERTFVIGQGNNAFVFPGIGLGTIVAHASKVTDGMLAAAARALAEEVSKEDLDSGSLFPKIRQLRAVTAKVAQAVARRAQKDGVARRQIEEAHLADAVEHAMWEPEYPEVVPA
jgi:malic enzyme